MNRRVRITTGARLHFGLLDVSSPFGGCGVMIDQPETIVEAGPAEEFEFIVASRALELHSRRVRAIASRLVDDGSLPSVRVELVQAAPPHSGLGSGTQLSLAIAEAILHASMSGNEDVCVDRMRIAADRGKRSAVGTYGYFDGGFIVEGLSATDLGEVNQVNYRVDLPAHWRVVVLLPKPSSGSHGSVEPVSGSNEQAKFDQLRTSMDQRQELSSILVGEMIPAIESSSFQYFTDAVACYNRASGMLFAPVQGGPYNGQETTRLIESLGASGYQGVGQSSWGPGVFVWFEDEESAEQFCRSWNGFDRAAWLMCPASSGRRLQVIDAS